MLNNTSISEKIVGAAHFLKQFNEFELFVYVMPTWFYDLEAPHEEEKGYREAYVQKNVDELGMRTDLSEGDKLSAIRSRIRTYEYYFDLANGAAAELGFDGDFDEGPNIIRIPYGSGFTVGFIFTQSATGECFVVSPVELSGLNERALRKASFVYRVEREEK